MDKELTKFVGSRIRLTRKKCKLTQAELASMVGLDQTMISKMELGETGISVEMLQNIAMKLGTTMAYLIGDIDWSHRPGDFEIEGSDDILPGQITPEMKHKREDLIM